MVNLACTSCMVWSAARIEGAGGKNILRGCFLAFLATFLGCAAFYTAPDAIAAQLGRVIPLWFYEGQVRADNGCERLGLKGVRSATAWGSLHFGRNRGMLL